MAGVIGLLVFAACFVAGLGAGTFCALHGHPWFALLILLITAGLQINTTGRR